MKKSCAWSVTSCGTFHVANRTLLKEIEVENTSNLSLQKLREHDTDTPIRQARSKGLHVACFLCSEACISTCSWGNPRYECSWGPFVRQSSLQSFIALATLSKYILEAPNKLLTKRMVATYQKYVSLLLLGGVRHQIFLML